MELDMIHNLESQYLRLGLSSYPDVGTLTPRADPGRAGLRCEGKEGPENFHPTFNISGGRPCQVV